MRKYIKFLVSGGISAAVSLLSYLMFLLVGLNGFLAYFACYFSGMIVNYFIQDTWVFLHGKGYERASRFWVSYFIVCVACSICVGFLANITEQIFPVGVVFELLSILVAALIFSPISFLIIKYLFKKSNVQ